MGWGTLHELEQGSSHQTRWTSHHQIHFIPEWGKEMAANLSSVSLLSRHLWPSTDLPLPQGKLTSLATWGWPPDAQLNMLTGRNLKGENHVVPPLCPVSLFFQGQGIRNPQILENGKLQLSIMLITIAQNKSQAEKSLDGNCYNCPNNGDEYFSLLNYMWLNI